MLDIAALSVAADWWSTVDHWAVGVVFIGVVVEGIAEWLPKERRESLLWTRITRTGWLVLVLALAVEYVAQKNKDADDAKIVAILNDSAAAANDRSAKVEDAAKWRSLQADTRAKLVSELVSGPGGDVILAYAGNDPEAVFLASRFDLIFREVNQRIGKTLWNVEIQPRIYSHGVFFGLRVLGPPTDAETEFMRNALTEAGVEFNTDPIPPVINDSPGLTIGAGPLTHTMIFVGPKWQPH